MKRAIAGAVLLTVAAIVLAVVLLGPSDENEREGSQETERRSDQRAPAGPPSGPRVAGDTLTIYSSMPLQGPTRPTSKSINNGAKLALQEHGGKAGRFTIQFETLDDATPAEGKWDPVKTQRNARKAARDKTTIAYIGEFHSGASANSIPILNRKEILQVSPSNTAVGLTADDPPEALERGEPDKHYPTGRRTYGRIMPNDDVQGRAIATDMKYLGCTKAFVVHDGDIYGHGVAAAFEAAAPGLRVDVVGSTAFDPSARNYRSLARRVRASGADCFLGSLIAENNGVRLFEDMARGNPDLRLWAPDGVAKAAFIDSERGGLSDLVAIQTRVSLGTLDPGQYPPAGRRFFERYAAAYGEDPEPSAIYGYEAMSVILDAIGRAGRYGNYRRAVTDAFFATKDRDSVLGRYSINQDGDTSLAEYGIYIINIDELDFERKVVAAEG
jgi:branched-chain amino acid transport system substrate-binding protein